MSGRPAVGQSCGRIGEIALKIVSGGQTGVDRAALDVAIARGIAYGGWCPLSGWAEDLPTRPGLTREVSGAPRDALARPGAADTLEHPRQRPHADHCHSGGAGGLAGHEPDPGGGRAAGPAASCRRPRRWRGAGAGRGLAERRRRGARRSTSPGRGKADRPASTSGRATSSRRCSTCSDRSGEA